MAFPVRRCALVGRLSDPRVAESVAALLPHLNARQVQVIVGDDAPVVQTDQSVLRVPEREIGAHADLVIAIGGGRPPPPPRGPAGRPPGAARRGHPQRRRVFHPPTPPAQPVLRLPAPPSP